MRPARTQDVPNDKSRAPEWVRRLIKALMLSRLLKWAWEELNLRPHAYQAHTTRKRSASVHGESAPAPDSRPHRRGGLNPADFTAHTYTERTRESDANQIVRGLLPLLEGPR